MKNLFAAFGAAFFILIILTVCLAWFTGTGKLSSSDKVVVVKLEGIITDPAEVTEELRDLEERRDVKAVVLRIDSPGGAVGPSQEIHSAIKRLRKHKVVVASMGSVAASGGYYAAVAANKIVANPGTITGSIGVIVEFINAEELLTKIGVKGYVVKSGKFKDTGSPLRKMTADEERLLQDMINDVNTQFIKAVAEGRKLKIEDVEKLADGRVFSGAQALDKGLIDSLGDLTDAVDLSAKLAKISGKPEVIYPEKKGFGLLRALIDKNAANELVGMFSGIHVMYLLRAPST